MVVFRRIAAQAFGMLTFGFATAVDMLSLVVGVALFAKISATLALLFVNREIWDQPGWGSVLWLASKVAPLIAVPCLIAIAQLENDPGLVRLFLATGLFVIIAVPLKIRQRRHRIADRLCARASASGLAD